MRWVMNRVVMLLDPLMFSPVLALDWLWTTRWCARDSGNDLNGSNLSILRLLLSKKMTPSPNTVLTSCIQWMWRIRGFTLLSLLFGGGNRNLRVFSWIACPRFLFRSPLGGVASVSSSSLEKADGGCLPAGGSWTEGSIIVGWRRYQYLLEIHVEKPSGLTNFS